MAEIDKREEEIQLLLNTFQQQVPTGKECCRMGEYFIGRKQYRQAIYWYKLALDYSDDQEVDYTTWIPQMQLCLCYSLLGDNETAFYYNELASHTIPNQRKIEYNRQFFERWFQQKGIRPPQLSLTLKENYQFHL